MGWLGLALLALLALGGRGRGLAKPRTDAARKTAEQAAHALRLYLVGGGDPGASGRSVDNVERAQRLMGGLVPTGWVDAATRRRAAELGASLPAEPRYQSAESAAEALADFLRRTGRHGWQKDRPPEVRRAQRDMGLPARLQSGVVGPVTRARARALGTELPPRPARYPIVAGEGGELEEGEANYDESGDYSTEFTDEEIELEHRIREGDLWNLRQQQQQEDQNGEAQ